MTAARSRAHAHERPRSVRAGMIALGLAVWSFVTEPLYVAITERRLAAPVGEAVVFAPLSVVLALLALRGGERSLRAVRTVAALLAVAEIPAGVFATTDPSLWWTYDPACGIVNCGLLHTLLHWSHVPLLVAIALCARAPADT